VKSKKKQYKTIIYDCDGVMFDSMAANFSFYQRVMTMMGRPPLDRDNEEQMRILHTYANREVLAHFFPDMDQWEEAVRCAGSIDYRDLVPSMTMEEGFRETLDRLKPLVGLAVCTNRSTSMDTVLELFDLTGYFDCVMTAAKVRNPKPHPEPLFKVLEHYGIGADEALFVGDSEVDRMAADAAGIPFVAYRAELAAFARIERHIEILELVG
jgi:HAD superfamily hydrolase (TIGR01509 family)